LRFKVRVRSGSSREEVGRGADGTLVVRVRARPERGEANRAAIAAVARFLGIPKTAVQIVAGGSGRNKLFEVPDRT